MVKPMLKKIFLVALFLFLFGIIIYYFRAELFVFNLDTVKDLASFNRVIPPSENCLYEDKIRYYYYSDPGDDFKNNKFGLYIYAENKNFFKIADKLVNSKGGDWGYVLIPYNIEDRDRSKWEIAFEQLNKRHLIPIIQLWSVDISNYEKQTDEAAEFLNSFLWPIKSRYISVYNEPNDSRFWGAKVDPEEYAQVLNHTIDTFKTVNPDFFILNGAFNASAPNDGNYMDEEIFMIRMDREIPGIFKKLDGWASHSYPQPNFSGSPYGQGRWSIKAYESELNFLKDTLNVNKELPVFITETGWAHAEGKDWNSSYLPVSRISNNFVIAFEEVWLKDDRVMAVTPFTIRYESPYDHFSWINEDDVPYEHYEIVKSIEKVSGNPPKVEWAEISVLNCEN